MTVYIYANLNDSYDTSAGDGTIDSPYTCAEFFRHTGYGENGFGVEEDTVYVLKGTQTTTGDLDFSINARYDNLSVSAIAWETTPWKIKTPAGGNATIRSGTSARNTPNIYFGGGIIETTEEGEDGFVFKAHDNPDDKILSFDNMWIHSQSV